MKILWIGPAFLHPTNRGGQIRTLEMLRCLRQRHEIHYLAPYDGTTEAIERSPEFCSWASPVRYDLAPRGSPRFWWQSISALFSQLPITLQRKRSKSVLREAMALLAKEKFDVVVCDFLATTVNLPPGQPYVLFEHNVETIIWRRYYKHAKDPVRRAFFRSQAQRLETYEIFACRRATHVITVSDSDATFLREMCCISNVSSVPTGVDFAYFTAPSGPTAKLASDLIFVGSMDWMPNIDGVLWFVKEVLPLIRRKRPLCSLVIAGRRPSAAIRSLQSDDSLIRVTGTADDVRPYLWSSRVSIVPLRVGSGTRLKIYESMAAGVPVVSTTIGAEGLHSSLPENIRIGDDPNSFSAACLALLENQHEHARQGKAGQSWLRENCSWEKAAIRFEEILETCRHESRASTSQTI
ncbi:MAG TPA: glycosyltransferase family 4 protein [Terriglobales bacterium]|nr:glycosyltransferase family 4 protein [Terriglobales bacterium]